MNLELSGADQKLQLFFWTYLLLQRPHNQSDSRPAPPAKVPSATHCRSQVLSPKLALGQQIIVVTCPSNWLPDSSLRAGTCILSATWRGCVFWACRRGAGLPLSPARAKLGRGLWHQQGLRCPSPSAPICCPSPSDPSKHRHHCQRQPHPTHLPPLALPAINNQRTGLCEANEHTFLPRSSITRTSPPAALATYAQTQSHFGFSDRNSLFLSSVPLPISMGGV